MSRVRDHWSIGEVLSLLQDEFPEVTISKIRFLESQGLISPERTTSGYRKFSDGDYDRLYWILEQQRDHYLPLRVIRDRLEEGQDIGPAPRRSDLRIGDQIQAQEPVEEPEPATEPANSGSVYDQQLQLDDPEAGLDTSFSQALAEGEGPVGLGEDPDHTHPVRNEDNALATALGASSAPADDPDAEAAIDENAEVTGDQADDEPTPPIDDESPYAEDQPDWITPTSDDNVAEITADDEAAEDDEPEIAEDEAQEQPAAESDSAESADREPISMTEPQPTDAPAEGPKPAPRLLGTRSEAPRPKTKTTAEALAPAPRPSLPGSSVALTREELAEQSGCTPGIVADLEKYGMISPRSVGSAVLFDSTALTVARLAVQFGRYGLEPRHLKTFRLGAEREVALLTQSIGPTLKANNPETRRRSYDTLQDLAELSASLRSIIVRDLIADLEPGS